MTVNTISVTRTQWVQNLSLSLYALLDKERRKQKNNFIYHKFKYLNSFHKTCKESFFQFLKGDKKRTSGLFTKSHRGRTRDNSYELDLERSHLDKEIFFYSQNNNFWSSLLRDRVESAPLEVSKT